MSTKATPSAPTTPASASLPRRPGRSLLGPFRCPCVSMKADAGTSTRPVTINVAWIVVIGFLPSAPKRMLAATLYLGRVVLCEHWTSKIHRVEVADHTQPIDRMGPRSPLRFARGQFFLWAQRGRGIPCASVGEFGNSNAAAWVQGIQRRLVETGPAVPRPADSLSVYRSSRRNAAASRYATCLSLSWPFGLHPRLAGARSSLRRRRRGKVSPRRLRLIG